MKADWCVLTALLGLLAAMSVVRSQPAANSSSRPDEDAPKASVRRELSKLLIEDANTIARRNRSETTASVPNDPGIVKMDPFVVRDQKLPNVVIPKFEAPFMHYLRTGTLFYSRGKSVTTRLSTGFSSDPHGFAQPHIQLKLSW